MLYCILSSLLKLSITYVLKNPPDLSEVGFLLETLCVISLLYLLLFIHNEKELLIWNESVFPSHSML
jgi:hypothetical protein